MGDRCCLEMTLRRADLPRFEPFVNARPGETWWDDEHQLDNPELISVSVYEANYAWYDQREKAAEAAIPFFGTHGEGGDYAGCSFASLGGEQAEVYADRDGMICLQIDEEMRLLTDLGYVRRYLEKLRSVEELFGISARNSENGTIDTEDEATGRIGEHYILHIAGHMEPGLHGPYPTRTVRDEAAGRIRSACGDGHGLYRLDLDPGGLPVIGPYTSGASDAGGEAA